MSKHTPGPWRYKPHSVDSNYMLIFCSNDPHEGDNLRGYCGEANARLIASAPDLLLRATALLEALDRDLPHNMKHHAAGERFNLRAAIAKATGESN